MNEIKIIQGDTYEAELEINGLEDLSVIEKCLFSSSYLGILYRVLTLQQVVYFIKNFNEVKHEL